MKLSELTRELGGTLRGVGDPEILRVSDDSREVVAGDLFVALRGGTHDATKFIEQAALKGAVAVLVENSADLREFALPAIVVPEGQGPASLAQAALLMSGRAAEKLRLIGITGTNGKTTTTFLVESILRAEGKRPGVIGTVNYRYQRGEQQVVIPAPFTTPTPVVLHRVFREMVSAQTSDVVMEVSSHALELGRIASVEFAVAAFSNLTQDHLDFHPNMQAYEAAKARLFSERLSTAGVSVAMIDDEAGERLLAVSRAEKKIRCSIRNPQADVAVQRVAYSIAGIEAQIKTPRGELALSSRLLGEFNLSNLVLAIGIGEALQLSHASILRGLREITGVPGRLDPVIEAENLGFSVVVDYAHTPDALVRAMGALRPLTHGRLWVVFGCGGDRDPTKRSIMGGAAVRGADLTVVTSDNPRTEDPNSIVDMILTGVAGTAVERAELDSLSAVRRGKFAVEPDRRAAIFGAIRAARRGDVILIAGKGHEDYQIVGKTKIHFDDKEEARAALASRLAGPVSAS